MVERRWSGVGSAVKCEDRRMVFLESKEGSRAEDRNK